MAIAAVWLFDKTMAHGIVTPGELPAHLTFTTNLWVGWIHLDWTPALYHFWSLATEEQFYLLAAPIVLFGVLSANHLCKWFVVIGVLSFGLLLALGAPPISTYTNPLVNFGLFAMGGLLHDLDADRWKERMGPIVVALLFAAFLLMPWVVGTWAPHSVADAVMWLAGVLMALLVFAVSLNQQCAVVRLLEWGPIAGLGRISYGVYVYHLILSAETIRLLTGGIVVPATFPRLLCVSFLFAVTILVSRISWDLIEAPALRLKDRILRRGGLTGGTGTLQDKESASSEAVRLAA